MILLKSKVALHPETSLEVGKEYKALPSGYGNSFRIEGEFVCYENLETPKERFSRLGLTADKQIVCVPHKGYTTDILQTESYLIMYQHSKGNHWNVFGNHYYYHHDINTGEHIPGHLVKKEPTIWKQRVLKAEAQAMQRKIVAAN